MKKIIAILLACLPLAGIAQSGWEKPLTTEEKQALAKKAEAEARKARKEIRKAQKEAKKNNITAEDTKVATDTNIKIINKDWKYIQKDAVPEINGKVVFTLDIDIPGDKNAQQIYEKTYTFLDKMAQSENQIESGIVLFNKNEHIIAAKYSEWIEFSKNFIMLDRTEFNYTIIAKCTDNHLKMTIERISYEYEKDRPAGFSKTAEELITDKYALNKKKTKLIPISAKFRRKTIDRKNEIFNNITEFLK